MHLRLLPKLVGRLNLPTITISWFFLPLGSCFFLLLERMAIRLVLILIPVELLFIVRVLHPPNDTDGRHNFSSSFLYYGY